jgi:hypothetical protein
MQANQHWEKVFSTKYENAVSWFQENTRHSVVLIACTGVFKEASIIDVGGGAFTLVDDLLSNGYRQVSGLDLSEAA